MKAPAASAVAALLGREGGRANHKRVLRLMRQDNLLCLRTRPFVPQTTDSKHGWRVVPNLARGMEPTGLDQLWVAAAPLAAINSDSQVCRDNRGEPSTSKFSL